MKVKDIMTRTPAVCTPETPLPQVARTMVDRDCGAVPLVRAGGVSLVGIITDRDIVIRAVAEGKNPLTLTAAACMTSPAITVSEDASADECTRLMESKKVRRMPVVDAAGALVGIVSQADIARHASRKESGDLVRDLSAPGR